MKLRDKLLLIALAILLAIITPQQNTYAATPSIVSESAILIEVSTGKIVYEKNSTKQMFPASTTKVMTAILTIENCNLTDIVTISESALSNIPQGYVTCGLVAGEELTIENLLYALMLPSANDAAYVLAEHVGGSVEGFSDMMNAKAKELGCTSTHFVNPNGIHDDNHYSSAYDLYLIAKYAMKNETFRKIVSTKEYTLPATNRYESNDRVLKTTNKLLEESSNSYYKYAIGIKTGYTSKAGDCLISEASRDGLDFIAVTLNGDRFDDTKKLYNYAYDNYTLTKIIETGSIVETIEIEKATKDTKNLDVIIDKSITVINNKSLDISSIIPEINYKENLTAPIEANTVVGTIKYKVEDIEYSANLLAKNDVEKQSYAIYFIGAGVALLMASLIIMPKKKKIRR
jgi:D-alanyl-D-alanine carboxypeptidase (penicillin-binding protein 5/6)